MQSFKFTKAYLTTIEDSARSVLVYKQTHRFLFLLNVMLIGLKRGLPKSSLDSLIESVSLHCAVSFIDMPKYNNCGFGYFSFFVITALLYSIKGSLHKTMRGNAWVFSRVIKYVNPQLPCIVRFRFFSV